MRVARSPLHRLGQHTLRIGRQVAGKQRRFAARVQQPPAHAGQQAAVARDLLLHGRAQRGQRQRLDPGAAKLRPLNAFAHQRLQDRGHARVLVVVDMVGLGGGEQHPVEPAAQQRAQPVVGAGAEAGQHLRHRRAQVGHRPRPGVERAQEIDQHHLPVDAGEVVAEERPDHLRHISVVTAGELGAQRSAPGARRGRQRAEGERGRAFQRAGHQEPPRRQPRQPVAAAGVQVARVCGGQRLRRALVERRREVARRNLRRPGLGVARAQRALRRRQRLRRPRVVAHRHQPQIEQPLAGIVHDVEMQRRWPRQAAEPAAGPVADRQPQLRDRPCGGRPARLRPRQRRHMPLEVEARHVAVGLRAQRDAFDTPVALRRQPREPPALQHVGHQRRDEHGLARAAEAGDAEAQRRLEQRLRHRVARILRRAQHVVDQSADHR